MLLFVIVCVCFFKGKQEGGKEWGWVLGEEEMHSQKIFDEGGSSVLC